MNVSLILVLLFPVMVIVSGLSLSPSPLRIDAIEPAERRAQHCRRISFLLVIIPAAVMSLIAALIVHLFAGGPGLLAYKRSLSFGGTLWKLSSIAGILCGVGGCLYGKRRSAGYQLIAVHAILLFIIIVGPYFQYAGHPD